MRQPGGAFSCSRAGDTMVRGTVQKGEEHREAKSQQESWVWSTRGQGDFTPCHSVMQSPNTCNSVAVWKVVSLREVHFAASLSNVTHLMSS